MIKSLAMSLKVDKPGESLRTLRAAEIPESLQVMTPSGARVKYQVAVVTWVHRRRGWIWFGWR